MVRWRVNSFLFLIYFLVVVVVVSFRCIVRNVVFVIGFVCILVVFGFVNVVIF